MPLCNKEVYENIGGRNYQNMNVAQTNAKHNRNYKLFSEA